MSVSDITVREALPEEYEDVGRLTVDAYREYEEGFGQFWGVYAAELADVAGRARDAKIIVAEQDSQLVGAVAYYPPAERQGGDFQSDWGLIRVLAVHPDHRGKGIGKFLTEECIRRAKDEGAAAVGLNTTQLMTVAKGMYERMGFEMLEEYATPANFRFWAYVYRF